MSEARAEQQSQDTNGTTAPPLFDADAPQTFDFNFQGRGKNASREYPVQITFGSLKDGDYIAYDKQRKVLMVGASDGVDASNETRGASLWLGRKLLKAVVGWGDPAGKDLSDERLVDAVQSGLLACDIKPKPAPVPGDATEDKPWEDDGAAGEPIELRCIAQGRLVITTHTPGAVDEETLARLTKRFADLKTKAKLVDDDDRLGRRATKVPSRAEEKGKIYDQMGFTATGYAGRVPLNHKEKIVDDFFEVEQELVEKKSPESSRL